MICVLSPEVDAVLMSVGPCVPLLSGGTRFQLSRSALGLSTLRAPSNAGCASLGARVPAPSHLCRSGVLASPAPAPSQTLKDPRLTGAPPLWYLLRALRRGRAPQDSTEESVSDACGLLRPCRRSGTPQGIPAAEAVLRALTFPRLARLRGTGQRRRKRCRARPNCMSIDYNLVQACDPALAFLTVKNTGKV